MIQQVSEKQLVRQVRQLAKQTRKEILDAGLDLTNFDDIARKYGIKLAWREMPIDQDGYYSKDLRTITLNSAVTNTERRSFNFCHELTHDRVDRNDDLYEQIHEFAAQWTDDTFMDLVIERLCNAGAAELLIPAEDVRQVMREQGFSTSLIPDLCERFEASSIAVALQMVNCASHDCYLVIAEPQIINPPVSATSTLLPMIEPDGIAREQLVIIYSGVSSVAKYSIKRHQIIPVGHMLYDAFRTDGAVRGSAKIPFASGNGWHVPCNVLYFRGKVFAFFNVTQPISNFQMRLL